MIFNVLKMFVLILVLTFFTLVFKYYFSDTNIILVKDNRENLELKLLKNISELPVLHNNTVDVIEFNSGFENSKKQNFKRSFWELFK